MNVKAWPFLISRSRTLGYRVIVVPQFLLEKKGSALLVKAAKGDLSAPNSAIYREVHGTFFGDISLVFHIILAEKRHIGLIGDEPLHDEFGRPIPLIEGMIFEKPVQGIMITKRDFQIAHEQVESAYRDFWNSSNIPAASPSHYFFLQGDSSPNEHITLLPEPALDLTPDNAKDNAHTLLARVYRFFRNLFVKQR